ncbi:cell division protein FtsQ [Flexibacter flexilis DSM 6793]|uniref:Cell division protein FtsQ n=1 Tax=Flexibacter flexilis DSM 6793 TaxID=927664 RepID=A0A1I1M5K7_9BACT|nr:cell division protein FtsQ [Flexibacter flexilis DSM 6793]
MNIGFAQSKVKPSVKAFFLLVVFFVLVGFAGKRQTSRVCRNIEVRIANQLENHFVGENDVLALLSAGQNDMLTGKRYSEINLKRLEKEVKKNKFVNSVQISHDYAGNMLVEVSQAKPVARVLRSKGRDSYLGSMGEILPVSPRYTARVLLLEGAGARRLTTVSLKEDEQGGKIFDLVNFINDDPFWQKMIVHLYIDEYGDIVMYPQMGKQIIDFGKPDDIELKFSKLSTFYKQIVPAKGWNYYSKVILKYNNQIICE